MEIVQNGDAAVKGTLRSQVIPAIALLVSGLGIYGLSLTVAPGLVTYLISLVGLIVIVLTAFARVNDMNPKLTGAAWQFRRVGLVFAGAGAFAMAASHIPGRGDPISWNETMFITGFAMSWLTTPNMPPWWRWISGVRNGITMPCDACGEVKE